MRSAERRWRWAVLALSRAEQRTREQREQRRRWSGGIRAARDGKAVLAAGASRGVFARTRDAMESAKKYEQKGRESTAKGLLHRMSVEFLLNEDEYGPPAGASGVSGGVRGGKGEDVTRAKGSEKESGARRFRCDLCGMKFSMRSNLKRHVTTVHEQRRVFRCELCGAAFGLKQNLCTHVRVKHHKVRAYKCHVCHCSFGYKQVLQNHLRSIHGLK